VERECVVANHNIIGRGLAAGAIGVLTVAVGSIGIATAANGGSLTIGHANTATSTTSLKDTHGTPLSLVAGKGKAPLAVNSKTLVKHLNADELDGLSASRLGVTASGAQAFARFGSGPSPSFIVLPIATGKNFAGVTPVAIAKTAKLAAGTYFVSASAFVETALCWVSPVKTKGSDVYGASASPAAVQSVAITQVFTLKKATSLTLFCGGLEPNAGHSGGGVIDQSLVAVKISHYASGLAVTPSGSLS
jgi:hypothetical protein